MSRDLKQLLHDTAAEPTSPVDPSSIVGRARRRIWATRAIVSIIAIVAVVGAALGAQQVLDTSQAPEIVDQPGQVQEPDGSVPSGWQTLRVGNATFAVPGEWSVQRIDGTDDPMPCLEQLATTEHRVYIADRQYTPSCPAPAPGDGDQPGQVTIYAFPGAGLTDQSKAIGYERVEFSRATAQMWDGDSYRTYMFDDLGAVLLVTYRWDPQLADRILNTVRPAAEPTVDGELDCLNDKRFGWVPGLPPEGAEGAATAEQALRRALGGYADRVPAASVVIVNERQASVVVNGREVATTRATGSDSGWFTSEVTGCEDGWIDPQDTGASTSEAPGSSNQSPTLDLARLRSVVESEMVEGLTFQESRTFQDGRGRDHIAVTYSRPHESRSLVIEVIQTVTDDTGWTALVADLNADVEDLPGGYERAISVRDSIIQVSVLTPDGLLTNVYAGSVPPATDAPMPATPEQLSTLATEVAQRTDSSGQPQP